MSTTRILTRRTACRILRFAVVGAFATLLGTGCGQSGPLFLPAESPAESTPPVPAATDDSQASGQAAGTSRAVEEEDDEKTP